MINWYTRIINVLSSQMERTSVYAINRILILYCPLVCLHWFADATEKTHNASKAGKGRLISLGSRSPLPMSPADSPAVIRWAHRMRQRSVHKNKLKWFVITTFNASYAYALCCCCLRHIDPARRSFNVSAQVLTSGSFVFNLNSCHHHPSGACGRLLAEDSAVLQTVSKSAAIN